MYRLGLRSGLHPVLRIKAAVPTEGTFFTSVGTAPATTLRNSAWDDGLRLYGYHRLAGCREAPDFLANPVTGHQWQTAHRAWFDIPDFDAVDGDVKMVWELSRFEWAIAFAQAARIGQGGALDRLNAWLGRWCEQNPTFRGPNWKCGQEGSIRILHLAVTALVLDPTAPPSARLLDLVAAHLRRIRPTLSYALGQDNNHGTSEAAALFVGGSWLASAGRKEGAVFARLGRRWLEERARRLFLPDGTFSQYSVNYHRLAVDTFVVAEVWRRHLRLPPFGAALSQRLSAATDWLHNIVSPSTGDAPNLGHNDGARIVALTDTPYRDYRPTVARGKALFANERAYDDPAIAADLAWLGIVPGTRDALPPSSHVYAQGGLAVLHRGRAMAVLRYPMFRFRPAHDDVMHLDLWLDGAPLLPDGGSYSYNAGEDWIQYFMGADSHNTVTFDGRYHMPKLGRFLFGAWPRGCVDTPLYDDGKISGIACSYRDWRGAEHQRTLILSDDGLRIVDAVAGQAGRALLRWRLGGQGSWRRDGDAMDDGAVRLTIVSDPAVTLDRIVEGYQSLHYNEKTPLSVLETEIPVPGRFETFVDW